MKLYGYWRSSSSWRVRIGLELKGLACEHVPVHLVRDGGQQHTDAHTDRNPLAQVPVLEVTEGGETVHLTQSLAILAYLDARFPEPRLIPEAPLARARVWQAAEIVNSGIQPVQNLSVLLDVVALGGDKLAWGRKVIARGFTALEALATEVSGTYLVGDTVSLADLCLVPQLYNAHRFGVDLEPFPTLTAIEARCAALPAFQAAHPDRQPDAPAPD